MQIFLLNAKRLCFLFYCHFFIALRACFLTMSVLSVCVLESTKTGMKLLTYFLASVKCAPKSTWTAFLLLLPVKMGFPGGSMVKNLPGNAGNSGLIPGFGRSFGEGNGSPLQYSCLEDPMDRGA